MKSKVSRRDSVPQAPFLWRDEHLRVWMRNKAETDVMVWPAEVAFYSGGYIVQASTSLADAWALRLGPNETVTLSNG